VLRVRGFNVALHWLYKNVQTPETEEQDPYDRNYWSKAKFNKAGRMPALQGNVPQR